MGWGMQHSGSSALLPPFVQKGTLAPPGGEGALRPPSPRSAGRVGSGALLGSGRSDRREAAEQNGFSCKPREGRSHSQGCRLGDSTWAVRRASCGRARGRAPPEGALDLRVRSWRGQEGGVGAGGLGSAGSRARTTESRESLHSRKSAQNSRLRFSNDLARSHQGT